MTPFESPRGGTTSADISSLETSLNATIRKTEDQMIRIEEQERRIRRFEEGMEVRERRTTEMLAILITLFTFLSVNINIFTRVSDIYTAIWFMLLMTVCSLLIASALFFFIHNMGKWYQLLLVLVFLVALTLLLVVPHLGLANIQLNPVEYRASGQ